MDFYLRKCGNRLSPASLKVEIILEPVMKPATEFIVDEFKQRQKKNQSYSLRAFSRDLGVSPGHLSDIISRQKKITLKTGQRLAGALQISKTRCKRFLSAVLNDLEESQSNNRETEWELISDDEFRLISDWHHFAILNLAKLDIAKSSKAWVARRLGISECEAEASILRLKRMGYISTNNGVLKRTHQPVVTSMDIPSMTLKQSHQQNLNQSIKAIYEVPVELREIISATVATSSDKLVEAKKMIRGFTETLIDFMEDGAKSEVYNINIQLVPVTKVKK